MTPDKTPARDPACDELCRPDCTGPVAEITRGGRWSWFVRISHGLIQWGPDGGPFWVPGNRPRAERVARRKLDQYRAHQARRRDAFVVR